MKLRIAGIERHSSVNGPGVRYVLFTQGCLHYCKGCQNPSTWPMDQGKEVTAEDIIHDILSTKYIDGVTLSGGDPLYQAKAMVEIAKALKEKNINLWCYTGFLYEEVLSGIPSKEAKELLSYIDVLIDGPFIQSLYSENCLYRGSTNQRLIDVKESLATGKIVLATSFDYGL